MNIQNQYKHYEKTSIQISIKLSKPDNRNKKGEEGEEGEKSEKSEEGEEGKEGEEEA